jgi:hypothetical protein
MSIHYTVLSVLRIPALRPQSPQRAQQQNLKFNVYGCVEFKLVLCVII